MIRNILKYFPLILLLPLFAAAQELPTEGGEDILSKDEMYRLREQQKANNLFFDANKAKITENADKAIELYLDCLKQDTKNDAAHYELAQLYYRLQEIDKSLEHAQKAYGLSPTNTWYSLTLASLYTQLNQPEDALTIYQQLHKSDPLNREYVQELANTWIQMDKPTEAVKVYDELEKTIGITEEISMRKHQIYLATGKNKKALEELEKLAGENAWDSRILSMLAEFYILQGKQDEALKTYHRIEEIDPENPYINISLADFYRKQGDLKKATTSLKKGFSSPYLDADTKIQVMMSYYSQVNEYDGIKDDIVELSRILVEIHPNEPKTLYLRGEMLMMVENYGEAHDFFVKANALDPGKYQTWENLMRASAMLENMDSLAIESNEAMELFPVQPMPYYFNGYANFLLKNYAEAIGSLNKGVKLVIGDKKLISDFYSLIGDAHHASGNLKETFAAYDASLKSVPDNPVVLNNYAYYLSLIGENLDKATDLAKQAIELAPANSYYLDTYAWVLYKKGDFIIALEYIEQAMKADSSISGTVWEHYGDILYKLNRTNEARDAWQNAKKAGDASEFLERKIEEGKLYE